MNIYKQTKMVNNCERFLKIIEKLRSCIGKFNKDNIIDYRNYLLNYIISKEIW